MEIDRDDAPASVDRRWLDRALNWLAVQFFLTVFAILLTFSSVFSVASCTATSCDYSSFTVSINTLYIGAIALLLVSGLSVILLRTHDRVMIWPPIVCSVLLVLLLVVTYVAGRAALTLPLFGNRVG